MLSQPQCPARPRGRHGGQAFGKNLAWAPGIITEKRPHAELHTHGVGTPRDISAGTYIPAVHSSGRHVAARARDTGGGRGHVECEQSGSLIDVPGLQGQGHPIR